MFIRVPAAFEAQIAKLNAHYTSLRDRFKAKASNESAATFGMSNIDENTLGGQGDGGFGPRKLTNKAEIEEKPRLR
ncbi:MAG TPA: hypothetical protein VKC54_04300 [Patescibacteria group bacterium]|nr:hypothetical protein [Patescibacteria group bacterium]